MPPKGTIYLAAKPRCVPGERHPSSNYTGLAKTDRAYGEIFSFIRTLRRRTFSHLDLPFSREKSRNALSRLYRNKEIRILKKTTYFLKGKEFALRIFTRCQKPYKLAEPPPIQQD